ncbi:hypothetical protein [Sediminitomix flava]|uniref:hypothetical protein n=1 Tax=Sediminitomix flava TaxID=379075 RepID=UPI0011B26B74|nr:hypothetical protein [Sediminitomix flava]
MNKLHIDIHWVNHLPLILGVFLLLALGIIFHIRQRKPFVATSILAYLLIGTGLLGLGLKPSILKEVSADSFLVIGQDTPKDSVAVFQKRYDETSVVTLRAEEKSIEGLDYLFAENPNVSSLRIATLELNDADVEVLSKIPFELSLPYAISGIIDFEQDNQIELGEKATISGNIIGDREDKKMLYLKGAEGILDSTQIALKEGKVSTFKFEIYPKQAGLWKYELDLEGTANILDFGIEVFAPQALKILLVNNSPDFEFKFLKNWLTEKEHDWAYHTAVSKEIYNQEKTKGINGSFSAKNQKYLEQFDLIITTQEYFEKLTSSSQKKWDKLVKNGIGLIVRGSSEKASVSPILKNIKLQKDSKEYETDYDLAISPWTLKTSEMKFEVSTSDDLIGSEVVFRQKGKVAINRVLNTYVWKLYSQKEQYETYWSELIQLTARKNKVKSFQFPNLVFNNQKTEVNADGLKSFKIVSPSSKEETYYLNVREDLAKHTNNSPVFEEQGWHAVDDGHGIQNIYVSSSENWKTYQKYALYQQLLDLSQLEKQSPKIKEIQEEVSQWWFVAILMVGLSILWVIQKL